MSTESATMATDSGSPPEKLNSKAWQTIAVVILAPFMTQMDATIVNVSLTSIKEDLHAPLSSAQWIISGYLLALALMLPLNGWLVDRFGTKRLYLFCFSSFTAASFLCGTAHTMQQLIGARILQGLAGGLLTPLTQLMMARIAGKQIARVVGYASAPVLLAPLLGPPLAGAILKYAEWPWLFYVNLPVGILAVALAALLIPHDGTMIRKRPFDVPGFLLLSPGLSCLLYGLEQFTHHQSLSFLVIGLLLLSSFIWLAARKKEKALIDLDLFRIRDFSSAAITQFLSNGILFAGQLLIPLYLISGAGLSPTRAGWVLTAMGIGMMCSYPLMGFLTERFGCRAVALSGVSITFVGTLPFLWMAHTGFSLPLSVAGLYLRGIGQGATGIPSLAAAYASVPKSKLSLAATAINIVQRLGAPITTTTLAIVISLSEKLHSVPGHLSYFIPFGAILVLQLLLIGSAARLPVRTQ